MSSLKDIAKSAGLSINTVSRAIRGRGYVSEDARKKVLRIAADLDYRPNRAARSLRSRKNFEIAVISFLGADNSGGDQLMMEKFVGIKRRLATSGYEMNLHFLDTDSISKSANLKLLEDIAGQNPDGIIVIGDGKLCKSIYRLMEAKKIPAVMISYDVIPKMDCVYIDRLQGVRDAVHYLAEKGRRRIAFAGYSGICCNRIRGYRKAVEELALEEIIFSENSYSGGDLERIFHLGVAMSKDIAGTRNPPDAVIAYSDYLAAGLIAGFRDLGVGIPEKIAVVGFDNRELAAFTSPGLTTIAQPNFKAGELAAEMLLDKISQAHRRSNATGVPMSLKIRRSA
ncbi:MAG: LacI family DNA-binding transcriptional regulator [Lentisphaerae bacterium]|nr:LacI family DNA-binding transcriptional regulator [Lentisphaerota bacterium]